MGFFGVKKRHPYPSGGRSFGVKAIIEYFYLIHKNYHPHSENFNPYKITDPCHAL
jgi:hypothetical protein